MDRCKEAKRLDGNCTLTLDNFVNEVDENQGSGISNPYRRITNIYDHQGNLYHAILINQKWIKMQLLTFGNNYLDVTTLYYNIEKYISQARQVSRPFFPVTQIWLQSSIHQEYVQQDVDYLRK